MNRSIAACRRLASARPARAPASVRTARRAGGWGPGRGCLTCELPPAGAHRSTHGPRPPSLDRIGGVVIARRRGMAGRDHAIDQRLILGGEGVVERADIIVPLRLR